MDDDGDWITARYILSSILGQNPLVVDYVDEESFPADPAPAGGSRAEAAVKPPPAVRATAGVAGTVCAVCTEEIAASDDVVRLPCAHWYHAACIAPWLEIRSSCPMCRAELPASDDGGVGAAAGREKPHARTVVGTSVTGVRRERGSSPHQYLAGGVLSDGPEFE